MVACGFLDKEPQINADERRFVAPFFKQQSDPAAKNQPQSAGAEPFALEKALPSRHGTRMTRIQRMFTDPCQSAPSAKSVFYRGYSRMRSNDGRVSAFICVHPRFFNRVIFQTGLTGFTGCDFDPVHPVILSNSKCHLPASRQRAKLLEETSGAATTL